MIKKIKLTKNNHTIIDEEDFQLINQYKWYTRKGRHTNYASRNICVRSQNQKKNIKRKYETIFMHRLIVENKLGRQLKKHEYIDHINHDGLDNRRCNLRIVNNSQNHMNTNKQLLN